jgi:hypothetical protein
MSTEGGNQRPIGSVEREESEDGMDADKSKTSIPRERCRRHGKGRLGEHPSSVYDDVLSADTDADDWVPSVPYLFVEGQTASVAAADLQSEDSDGELAVDLSHPVSHQEYSQTASEPSFDDSNSVVSLSIKLRKALVASEAAPGSYFLPARTLERTVTRESVREELGPRAEAEYYSRMVCPDPGDSHHSLRRIFAILVLIEQLHLIETFINESLDDGNLPLLLRERDDDSWLKTMYINGRELVSFCAWSQFLLDSFDHYQWFLLAPQFKFLDENGRIPSTKLPSRTILPFTSLETKTTGNYGTITRVAIHPAHHNFSDYIRVRFKYRARFIYGVQLTSRRKSRKPPRSLLSSV